MKNAAGLAAMCVGSLAYLELLRNWFFKSYPSIHVEHNREKQEARVHFTTLTAAPCIVEKTTHSGLPCLQEVGYNPVVVTSHAVAGETLFRVPNVGSLGEFEGACDACRVHTEISYRNEFGVLVTKQIPWTHTTGLIKDIKECNSNQC